jgi:hypothetical protein
MNVQITLVITTWIFYPDFEAGSRIQGYEKDEEKNTVLYEKEFIL